MYVHTNSLISLNKHLLDTSSHLWWSAEAADNKLKLVYFYLLLIFSNFPLLNTNTNFACSLSVANALLKWRNVYSDISFFLHTTWVQQQYPPNQITVYKCLNCLQCRGYQFCVLVIVVRAHIETKTTTFLNTTNSTYWISWAPDTIFSILTNCCCVECE